MKKEHCIYYSFLYLSIIPAEACPFCGSPSHRISDKIADKWIPFPYGNVKIGGEIEQQIDITINNNIKKLDLGTNFLGPFSAKQSGGGIFL
jgi:hypothetical protein